MRHGFLAFAFIAALVHQPAKAAADYLLGYTGNTSPGVVVQDASLKGTVNFAVLDRYGGQWGDVWGTGMPDMDDSFVRGIDAWGYSSPYLDTGARYLYLYQVVNDDPDANALPINAVAISLYVDPYYITSWGYFDGLGFADDDDDDGVRTPVSASNVFGLPHDHGNPASFNTDVTNPDVVSIGSHATDPGLNPDETILVTGAFRGTWYGNKIHKGKRGVIFGFTTDLPPTTGPVTIHCGHVGQPPCQQESHGARPGLPLPLPEYGACRARPR